MFVSAAVGFCALTAITRGLRGDEYMGNYYLDMWRVVAYVFRPASLLGGVLLMAAGVPMTFEKAAEVSTLEPGAMGQSEDGAAKKQVIARGPVAASRVVNPSLPETAHQIGNKLLTLFLRVSLIWRAKMGSSVLSTNSSQWVQCFRRH
jgi:hypothetical protein